MDQRLVWHGFKTRSQSGLATSGCFELTLIRQDSLRAAEAWAVIAQWCFANLSPTSGFARFYLLLLLVLARFEGIWPEPRHGGKAACNGTGTDAAGQVSH